MRNLLVIVMLCAVLGSVIGFRQGWLAIHMSCRADNSSVDVHLRFNADKVRADANLISYLR